MHKQNTSVHQPLIPAHQHYAELTFKGLLLGILLVFILSASNAYLALKVGVTVSGCIPAAVISMSVLRVFSTHNVLENNMIQTLASAGECIAAGVAFTIPALVVMGYWNYFPFYEMFFLCVSGGLLGVCLSVPLRRAFIVDYQLEFPEGVAVAEVLKTGHNLTASQSSSSSLSFLLNGGLFAAVIKFFQSGLYWMVDEISFYIKTGSAIWGFGTGFSLSTLGAGYIVGHGGAFGIIVGTGICWLVLLPLCSMFLDLPHDIAQQSTTDVALYLWVHKVRLLGVGAMFVGGIWSILGLIKPLKTACASAIHAMLHRTSSTMLTLRTERDLSFSFVLIFSGLVAILMAGFLISFLDFSEFSLITKIGLTFVLTAVVLLITFLSCALGAYMVGLLGSTNMPLSGVLLIALMVISIVLLFVFDPVLNFHGNPEKSLEAAAIVIMLSCFIACAAAVSGDNLQDLKTGYILGSTPWKQQLVLILGVVLGSLAIAPVVNLLFQAYGLGDVMPRAGMDPTQALSAPKATMLASLSQSIFMQTMDWSMISIGMGLGFINVVLDHISGKKGWLRFPAIAVALGVYLPLSVTVPLYIGALINVFSSRKLDRSLQNKSTEERETYKSKQQSNAVLLGAGFITGEALLGVLLAIPFALYQTTDVFRVPLPGAEVTTMCLGGIAFIFAARWMYRLVVCEKNKS